MDILPLLFGGSPMPHGFEQNPLPYRFLVDIRERSTGDLPRCLRPSSRLALDNHLTKHLPRTGRSFLTRRRPLLASSGAGASTPGPSKLEYSWGFSVSSRLWDPAHVLPQLVAWPLTLRTAITIILSGVCGLTVTPMFAS